MGRRAARRPCPFCEHAYTDMVTICLALGRPRRDGFCVECCACKATGPLGETKPEAATLWDRAYSLRVLAINRARTAA